MGGHRAGRPGEDDLARAYGLGVGGPWRSRCTRRGNYGGRLDLLAKSD